MGLSVHKMGFVATELAGTVSGIISIWDSKQPKFFTDFPRDESAIFSNTKDIQ